LNLCILRISSLSLLQRMMHLLVPNDLTATRGSDCQIILQDSMFVLCSVWENCGKFRSWPAKWVAKESEGVFVVMFLHPDISGMLTHSGLEVLLSVSNVNLACVLTLNFIDNQGVVTEVVVFTLTIVFIPAVAW
jgi:hypothetical protein